MDIDLSNVTVCTGWHPAAYDQYARTFLATFDHYWRASIDLQVYPEIPLPPPRGYGGCLWDIPGAREFDIRHRAIPEHCGRAPTRHWRPKDRLKFAAGTVAWRWDAMRWFKQCIIPHHAAQSLPDGDILVWLDADVVTFADVPEDMIEGLLGPADLCYLGRTKGSEIGFWAVRLGSATRAFLAELSALYLDDGIFALREYHSAFAFDHARRAAQRRGLRARDLTPGGAGHVWMRCEPLMRVCDHLKGPRKALGYSPEHPLRWWERIAA